MPAKGIGPMLEQSEPARRHIIVVGGGGKPLPRLAARLAPANTVICADRGYAHALALGLRPTLLVGDLDSLSAADLDHARASATVVEMHPSEKEATDLELALDRAVDLGHEIALHPAQVDGTEFDRATTATTLTVVATPDVTERIDHLLAQLGLLASPKYAHVLVKAWFGEALVTIVHPGTPAYLQGVRDELVTLLPVGAPANGVTTTGLRFALANETLSPFSTRGVSNLLEGRTATVSVSDGALAIIQPHALRGHS
jgi:thiamine pyrophosphokinase